MMALSASPLEAVELNLAAAERALFSSGGLGAAKHCWSQSFTGQHSDNNLRLSGKKDASAELDDMSVTRGWR